MSCTTDDWWRSFTENMPNLDGSSSSANTAWALQQRCFNPLDKLLLLRIADGVGGQGFGKFSVVALAEFSCSDELAVRDALLSLCQSEFISILEEGDAYTVAMPWWFPGRNKLQSRSGGTGRNLQFKPELRNALTEKQCGACWYCGTSIVGDVPTPHVEHQTPLSRGGLDVVENLVMACRTCNTRKSDRTVEEYRAYLSEKAGKGIVFYGEPF